jgi:hypothetical protein
MPFFINRNFENQLYEYLASIQAWVSSRPINLGGMTGPGGGSGTGWGLIGQLPQMRVSYDTTEASDMGLPASGWSLVDNLNHIRGRITVLEEAAPTRQTIFTTSNTLGIYDNPLRVYNKLGTSQTITEVFLSVGTAPTGSAIIVDIHKNGTTIFTNQSHRPTITAGNNTGYTTNIDIPTWADESYLTAHIDAVGSTVPGSDLVVHVTHN